MARQRLIFKKMRGFEDRTRAATRKTVKQLRAARTDIKAATRILVHMLGVDVVEILVLYQMDALRCQVHAKIILELVDGRFFSNYQEQNRSEERRVGKECRSR